MITSAQEEPPGLREINPAHIQIVSEIGEGTTSVVYLGNLEGKQVAVKEIRVLPGQVDAGTVQAVQRELRVLSAVTHPNILHFVGLVTAAWPLRIILEYCAGGSLFELLHNSWKIQICWRQKFKMLLDTASATDYLHNFNPPILHRDLKSLNLMLLHAVTDEHCEPQLKLADFGVARVWEEKAMTQCVGTKHWMAPEVLNSTEYTEKADVFSFAMVAFEVICRQVPFESLDATAVATELSAGRRPELEEAMPKEAPQELAALVHRCWAQAPLERPSFAQVRKELVAIGEALGEV